MAHLFEKTLWLERPWVTLKYGGTSVATKISWQGISNHVKDLLPNNRIWITVSAISQV